MVTTHQLTKTNKQADNTNKKFTNVSVNVSGGGLCTFSLFFVECTGQNRNAWYPLPFWCFPNLFKLPITLYYFAIDAFVQSA